MRIISPKDDCDWPDQQYWYERMLKEETEKMKKGVRRSAEIKYEYKRETNS